MRSEKLLAAIDLTLGIAVGQSEKNISEQVGQILSKVGATATPLKIKIDKNSYRGEISELQAMLRNAFRAVNIDLSDLTFVGDSGQAREFSASVRSITDELVGTKNVAKDLAAVLRKTFEPSKLEESSNALNEMSLEAERYLRIINNAEAGIRRQEQSYRTNGGADYRVLNQIASSYNRLQDLRAQIIRSIAHPSKNAEERIVGTVEDAATGQISFTESVRRTVAEQVTPLEKEFDTHFENMLSDVKLVESELRNLNSMLAENARLEKEAFTFDKTGALTKLNDMQASIDRARTDLAGAGNEMLQNFDAELEGVAADLDLVKIAMENGGSGAYELYKESVAEATLKLSEFRAALAASKTPDAPIDPTGDMGTKGEASLTRLINKYHDVMAEYNKLISGTDLGSGAGAGMFGDLPTRERELLDTLKLLKDHELTVGQLSDALTGATRNLESYGAALTNLSDIKQSGTYNILGGGDEENKVRSTAATLQTELTKIETAGGSLKTRFAADIQDVIAAMETLSAGFSRSGVEATEYAAAMDSADAVLNRLKQAQAAASAPEALIETDTEAYRTQKIAIEELISALNTLERKYLDLGHISTGDFVTGTGASFDNVRGRANELLANLNAGVLTNGDAASGRGWISEQTEQLSLYVQEMTNAGKVQKNLLKASEEYRSLVGRGTKVTKDWTAAKLSPETVQSYNAVSQAVKNLNASYEEFVHNPEAPGAFERINESLQENGRIIDEDSAKIRIFGRDYASMGTKVAEKFKTLLTYTIGARVIYGAVRKMRELVTEAVNLDSAMGQLRIVTNETENAYRKFGETAGKTAKELGVSLKDLIDATTTYSRLGYSLDESSILSKYTAMLSKVGDIDASTAQSAVTSMIKAFNIDATSVDDIERVMDKLVVVGNNFPISVSQISEGMMNASSSLVAAGNSFDQSVALLTAANTTVNFCRAA